MAIERQRLAVDAEDISGRRMQRSIGDETIDGVAVLETGIDADQRLRPEPVVGVKLLDLLLESGARIKVNERANRS
jgi:hypothetical protein